MMTRQMRGNVPAQVPGRRYLEPAAKPGANDATALAAVASGIAAAVWLGASVRRWI